MAHVLVRLVVGCGLTVSGSIASAEELVGASVSDPAPAPPPPAASADEAPLVSAAPSLPSSVDEAPSVSADRGAPEEPVEVSVRGRTRGDALARSANAVTVVDLTAARHEASDLGDVIARRTAVTMQRAGGLGSRAAFSLGGLGGERLRFFVDGVPLDLMGYVAGIQNVPVNLVERVEVYQGVVPVRFGADALGGAVQLVTDENLRKSRLSASYQMGDFGVHRATASARAFDAAHGLVVRSSVFYDTAANDYLVDVSTFDARGRTRPVTVPRFHDGYRAGGVHVGVGLVDRAWADRLVVSAFLASFDKDLQNGATMARPYGEVTFKRQTSGVNVKYAVSNEKTRLDVVAGYAAFGSTFLDLSNCVYDWYGRCTPRTPATLRGEIGGGPVAIDLRTGTLFLRTDLTRELGSTNAGDRHRFRVALAPTYADRSGKNALRGPGYDALAQPRRLFTGVAGVEFESGFFEDRVQNIAFLKGYGFVSRSESLLATGAWKDMSRDIFRVGGGDSLRFAWTRDVYTKASYEYAMRQPSTDELFGDGMMVLDNLSLRPETSHNANVGAYVEKVKTAAGSFRGSVMGFARWSDDMIALLSEGDFLRNVNVWQARTLGVESTVGWTVPSGDWFSLEERVVYQDIRNRSSEGPFARQEGDRIPSIPYLLSNGTAQLRARGLVVANDTVDFAWNVRYVHAFYRGWESLATRAQRLSIDAQLSHGALLTYALKGEQLALAMTLEAQNLTNEKLFDFYGVQRPGRAFFTKWTLDW